jgi:SAM-dependent methyltransferase
VRQLRRLLLDRVLERTGETGEAVRLDDLGIDKRGYHDYEPSGWRSFSRAMRDEKIGREHSFLDIGCGKGRVVAQAARQPFKRVLGVELSAEMAESARQLLAGEQRRRRCEEVEIFVADVTTWEVPDDVTHIYLYNALSGDALIAVLDRIAESAARRPRQLLFIYANPIHESDVLAHPSFELAERRGSRRWSPTDPRRLSICLVGT